MEMANRVPADPRENTAGMVAITTLERHNITDDINIEIRKGVPPGFGLGSSAASAAAAAIACDELYGLGQTRDELVAAAGQGEKASAGSVHYDNVAASILGGFVIVRPEPLTAVSFEPSADIRCCVAIPRIDVPGKKTAVSRNILPKEITLKDHVSNLAGATLLATALATGNTGRLGGLATDIIAEPARKHMIPGFDEVKGRAIKAGAKEVMISGAGPSVIAITDAPQDACMDIARAMEEGFATVQTRCRVVVCKPAGGAEMLEARA